MSWAAVPWLFAACAAVAAGWWLLALVIELRSFVPFVPARRQRRGLGHDRWSASAAPADVDVVVIGSGMAGLSCASMLASFGRRVLVLEQHEVIGGGAHCYAVDGKSSWKFDSGLHYTIPQAAELLALAAGTARPPVEVARMGERMDEGFVYDRVLLCGADEPELRIASDVQLLAELQRRFPEHARRLEAFWALSGGLLWRFPLWCASALLPWPLRRLALRLGPFALWRAWSSRTADDALRELIPGEGAQAAKLRGYLSGLWIDAGCPPSRMSFFMLAATTVGFPHEGGAYPTGGPAAMALALAEALEARGGRVLVRARVRGIDVAGGAVRGVVMDDGTRVRAPVVVSATGYRNTVERLLPPEVAASHGMAASALRTAQSDGFVMANIALDGSAAELGIDCTNLWLQPAGAAHGHSLSAGVDAYLRAPLDVPLGQLPLMLTFPSAKDRAWAAAHPRHSMCQVLALAPHAWFAKYQGAERPAARHAPPALGRESQAEYDELKRRWAERCERALLEHYPSTKGRVAFVNISTPLTIEHYLPSTAGSAIGLDVTPSRFTDEGDMRRLDMRTSVRGLWLTGQDTLMAGQPLAQLAGVITALRIAGPVRASGVVCRTLLLKLGLLGGATTSGADAGERKAQ